MDFLHSEIGSAKDNVKSPIHNWYKFTAGFSYKFVEAILDTEPHEAIVYEPFAGCGTTLVSSQKKGVKAIGNEGQEFMYDIIRAKLCWDVCAIDIENYIADIEQKITEGITAYDITKEHSLLQELYTYNNLTVLCIIRDYITSINDEKYRLFFKLALSQILHKTSIFPIAIPYISRSKKLVNNDMPFEKFKNTCSKMLEDVKLQNLPNAKANIFLHDSRFANDNIADDLCTICITSPPYLNNLDYGEVSKVHTHFFGITNNWNDITNKVRVNLVTGATTHYKESEFDMEKFKGNEFASNNSEVISYLEAKFNEISVIAKTRKGKKSFHILMMHYFEDMFCVLKEIRRVLKPGSKAYLILGDSAPYGVFIPTTKVLGDIAMSTGFSSYKIEKIRSRGTKWKSLKNRHSIELSENVLILQ